MKKLLLILSLSTLFVMVGCSRSSTGDQEQAKIDMQTFSTTWFSIQYPVGRNYQENVYGSHVMFFSPQLSWDNFRENVGIVSERLPDEMSIDDYYMTIQQQLSSFIQNYQEISNEDVSLGTLPAKKVVYVGAQGDYKLKRMQTILIKDKQVYILSYTASEGTFDDFSQEAEAMMASFQLK